MRIYGLFLLLTARAAGVGCAASRAVRQIDHIIAVPAAAVVEAAADQLDPGGAALQIMAAGAALEAAVRDPQGAVVPDID